MSQAGLASTKNIPPPPGSITDLQGQDGVTVPPNGAGIIFVQGAVVAAGTTPFTTTGNAGTNTETWSIQRTQAAGASAANIAGLSSFNSAQFSVDANGFVSLIGGGAAVDSFAMQTGSNPVVPTIAGLVTFNGAIVLAGSNPVRTDGTGPNTMTLEVQISSAIASTNSTKIGLAAFNSANFSVDANGFVSTLAQAFNYTSVNAAASPYTVLETDYYISVDSSGGPVTLNFPNAPTFKRLWIIKDRVGSAATNNISITTPGGIVTFDGLTTYVMNSNFQAINLLANATPTYEVY